MVLCQKFLVLHSFRHVSSNSSDHKSFYGKRKFDGSRRVCVNPHTPHHIQLHPTRPNPVHMHQTARCSVVDSSYVAKLGTFSGMSSLPEANKPFPDPNRVYDLFYLIICCRPPVSMLIPPLSMLNENCANWRNVQTPKSCTTPSRNPYLTQH